MNGLISADKVCLWFVDDPEEQFERLWNSGCGHTFYFTDQEPDENGWKYCPWCGKLLLREGAKGGN
jgi:hypothetical protein